jgi:hypothetical protein
MYLRSLSPDLDDMQMAMSEYDGEQEQQEHHSVSLDRNKTILVSNANLFVERQVGATDHTKALMRTSKPLWGG